MTVQRSEQSDRGGSHGPERRGSSLFVSSVGAFFAIVIAPLAVIAIVGAIPPDASSDVSVLFVSIFAVAALVLSGFGFLGARIARSAGSRAIRVYGWVVGVVLLISAALLGAAAILHSIA